MEWQIIKGLKQRARHLKAETMALYFAARHSQTPWYAKVLVAVIVAYALSPIDLIPDFIPILGYLDDLILIPIGIYFAIKIIPQPVLHECRLRAQQEIDKRRPVNYIVGILIVIIWITVSGWALIWLYKTYWL